MSIQNRGIESVLKKLPNKSRFQFFLFFVILSLTLWTSTKLSKVYQVVQPFSISWVDIPKGIVLNAAPTQIKLSISASGMEILWYRLFKRRLKISLKEIEFTPNTQVVTFEPRYFELQQQLLGDTQLNQITPSLFPLPYHTITSKKLPVMPSVSIDFRPGYLAVDRFKVIPDSILVYGTPVLLDSIKSMKTEEFKAEDVHQTIDHELVILPFEGIEFEVNRVRLYGDVLPFSEKTIEVPVQIQNKPEGIKIKLFPPNINLVTTAPLDVLGNLGPNDFTLAVDYNQIKTGISNRLEIKILKQPSKVKKINWEPTTVNFLVRK